MLESVTTMAKKQNMITVLAISMTMMMTMHDRIATCSEPMTNHFNMFDTGTFGKCLADNTTTDAVLDIDAVSKLLVQSCQTFALQLFKSLNQFESKSNSNGLLFSPSSIWSTLMVTYLGSKGATEKELRNRLKLKGASKTALAIAYRGMQMWQNLKAAKMSNLTSKTQLSDVNKIFVASQLGINSCFRDLFPEMIETKDFAIQPTQSLASINDWISKQTSGKIVDLLPDGSITPFTKVVIANAVYFKSSWAQQFDASKTKKDKFMVSPTEEIEVDMMRMDSANLLYGASEGLQATAVELPYSNPDYSMVIILPTADKGLDSLLRDLTVDTLQELLRSMVDDDVNIAIPKFKVEQEFELAGPLYSLGIKKLFDPRFVDLSVIFRDSQDSKETALDSVLHKSYINVNEEGTEAAAATALIFARSGRPLFPTEFIANRPFLYLIRDTTTSMILFVGTVRRPQAEGL